MSRIQDFRSEIIKGEGLAKPNRYGVRILTEKLFQNPITRPAFTAMAIRETIGDHLDFFCGGAELSGKNFATTEMRFYGPHFKLPYNPIFTDLSLSFYVSENMVERDFFDAWQYVVENPISRDFNYLSEYSTDIIVYQLNQLGTIKYGIQYFEAWPINVQQLELSYDQNDVVHRLPVQFSYTKWENVRLDTAADRIETVPIQQDFGRKTRLEETVGDRNEISTGE